MRPNNRKLALVLLCLMMISLACSLMPQIITRNNEDHPDHEKENPTQNDNPTQPEPIVPDEDPPSLDTGFLPAGFAIQRECTKALPCTVDGEDHPNGMEMTLISANNQHAFSVYQPARGNFDHIASSVDFRNPDSLAFIFQNYDASQYEIHENGSITRTFPAEDIRSIHGVPGVDVFAISYLPGTGTDSGHSEIHVSPGMGSIVTSYDPQKIVVPVLVNGDAEGYTDLWFTYELYGIGGDIIFPPNRGLFHVEGYGDPQEIISEDAQSFSAISQDGNLVAFSSRADKVMTIRNFITGADTNFSLRPEIDRGAGWATFSPDGQKLAWLEAMGSALDGNYASFIRVGTAEGLVVKDIPSTEFVLSQGFVRPVGWLDNDRLLIEANVFGQENPPAVWIVNVNDSPLRESTYGLFVGLVYE